MLLAGILLLAMAGIGHGYASWNREQSISMELATGKFKHFFSQKGDCSAEIVDEAGNELQSIASDWKTTDNRTTAEISFREGLPMELLAEGNYLCLSYPIEKNGTVVHGSGFHKGGGAGAHAGAKGCLSFRRGDIIPL